MKNIHKHAFALVAFLLFCTITIAQNPQYDTTRQAPASVEATEKEQHETAIVPDNSTPEMADRMRGEGKIYVVVAIILVILAGFIVYLVFLDRKIGKAEDILARKR